MNKLIISLFITIISLSCVNLYQYNTGLKKDNALLMCKGSLDSYSMANQVSKTESQQEAKRLADRIKDAKQQQTIIETKEKDRLKIEIPDGCEGAIRYLVDNR